MAFKIGFTAEKNEEQIPAYVKIKPQEETEKSKKSLVRVYFPKRNQAYTYYNDKFDLKCGDSVYVEGKLEGQMGTDTELSYNFKIKFSDYKRVIFLVDTNVSGQFYMGGSHFISFNKETLPREKAVSWFKAPTNDEFVFESDDDSFLLSDIKTMKIDSDAAQKGHDYYIQNKVCYLCLENGEGYAIVEGREAYEIEFLYKDGEIRNLVCPCFCSGNCKHNFAAMLQLRETLEIIEKNYAEEYEKSDYFCAVNKGVLFSVAIDGKENGSFIL